MCALIIGLFCKRARSLLQKSPIKEIKRHCDQGSTWHAYLRVFVRIADGANYRCLLQKSPIKETKRHCVRTWHAYLRVSVRIADGNTVCAVVCVHTHTHTYQVLIWSNANAVGAVEAQL